MLSKIYKLLLILILVILPSLLLAGVANAAYDVPGGTTTYDNLPLPTYTPIDWNDFLGPGTGETTTTTGDGRYEQGDPHVSPVIHGRVVTQTGAPLGNVLWVKWTDKDGHYRYMTAGEDGYFTFPGWHSIGRSEVERQNNTQIDTDFNSQNDTPQANTTEGNAFQCIQNPHQFTSFRRVNMPAGSFSTVNADLPNSALEYTISNIIFTPAPPQPPTGLTNSCPVPGTQATLSWQAPDSTSGYSYLLRVDKNPDSWGGGAAINPGDVLNDNVSSPYSFSTEPGKNYKWWVHACRSGNCSDQETSAFICDKCPSAPQAQSPANGSIIACTATASNVVELTWTGSAGSKYNIRVDGDGVSSADNIANTCSTHSICVDGLTGQSFKIKVQPGKSYTWWVDIQAPNACGYLTTGVKTFTTASCVGPKIDGLNIIQENPKTQNAGNRISGSQSTQGGIGFYNPLDVELRTTQGTAAIKEYYVAFYNTSLNLASSTGNPLDNLKSKVSNPQNGFLLKYDSSGNYTVWNAFTNKFEILKSTTTPHLICLSNDCTNENNWLFGTRPKNDRTPHWAVHIYKAFGDKQMFTGAYILDEKGLSDFKAEITPP